MPSTRSQGGSQPTLQFPRRKSCRVSQKTPLAPPSKPESFTPSQLSPRRPADPPLSPLRLPASPPKQQSSVQPILSPRRPRLPTPPSSPALQTRLPLSPRKRTGETVTVFTPCRCLPQYKIPFSFHRSGKRLQPRLRPAGFSSQAEPTVSKKTGQRRELPRLCSQTADPLLATTATAAGNAHRKSGPTSQREAAACGSVVCRK